MRSDEAISCSTPPLQLGIRASLRASVRSRNIMPSQQAPLWRGIAGCDAHLGTAPFYMSTVRAAFHDTKPFTPEQCREALREFAGHFGSRTRIAPAIAHTAKKTSVSTGWIVSIDMADNRSAVDRESPRRPMATEAAGGDSMQQRPGHAGPRPPELHRPVYWGSWRIDVASATKPRSVHVGACHAFFLEFHERGPYGPQVLADARWVARASSTFISSSA